MAKFLAKFRTSDFEHIKRSQRFCSMCNQKDIEDDFEMAFL